MEHKCNICNRNFNSEESLIQHNSSKHPVEEKKGKTSLRRYFILIIITLIVVFSSFTVYSYTKKPGQYDEFAKCLTANGAVIYGNDYCQYTAKQLNYFGKSRKHLNYIKCSENENLCNEKNVKITPTWEINGKMYEQVQNFEILSELSGCEL